MSWVESQHMRICDQIDIFAFAVTQTQTSASYFEIFYLRKARTDDTVQYLVDDTQELCSPV